jgi:hypothetical protein
MHVPWFCSRLEDARHDGFADTVEAIIEALHGLQLITPGPHYKPYSFFGYVESPFTFETCLLVQLS